MVEVKNIPIPTYTEPDQLQLTTNESLAEESSIKDSINIGDVRRVATTLFDDYLITCTENDLPTLESIFANEQHTEGTELFAQYLRQEVELTEPEINHISRLMATIVQFNGKQIGEGVATAEDMDNLQKKRLDFYKNTDRLGHYRVVSLASIQSQGIAMCVEASMVAQVLSQKLPGYTTLEIESTAHANSENAEGHTFILLITEGKQRVLFVDLAYSVPVNCDGKVIGMPFVVVLSKEQLLQMGEGYNVKLLSMGTERYYRVGPSHAKDGTWKTSLSEYWTK